jgi:ABC-type nitrate/sulfonate/bicarbonate transport system permease component
MLERTKNAAGRATLVVASFAALGVVWQLAWSLEWLDHSSFPSVGATLQALWDALGGADGFWGELRETLIAWIVGLAIGSVAGIALGALMGMSAFAYGSMNLVVEFFKTIPAIAALPLAILLFGATVKMNVLLVSLGITWPILIQTAYGVRSVEPLVRDTAMVYRMSPAARIWSTVLPSAAPYIATGMRLAATGGLLLVVVAQLVGGGTGLGYAMVRDENAGVLDKMYAMVLVIGVLGVVISWLFGVMERYLLRWHESQRPQVV